MDNKKMAALNEMEMENVAGGFNYTDIPDFLSQLENAEIVFDWFCSLFKKRKKDN